MNIVIGNDFYLLRRRAINLYGAKNLEYSHKTNKKYGITLKNNNKIHFGDTRFEDYLIHKNKYRRDRYRKRASNIKDKDGNLTYKNRNSANFWSYHLLW